MPLTKVRYDMLDPEITQKISDAGSPLVFTPTNGDPTVETLTKFKLNGEEEVIRSAAFSSSGKLVITLATFTPRVEAVGQTDLDWDVAAQQFKVSADNPADYPSKWVKGIKFPLVASSGSVSLDSGDYAQSGSTLPLAATADFTNIVYNLTQNAYIRPVIALSGTPGNKTGPATGGSAAATVTFETLNDDDVTADWTTTKTWTTTWKSVSNGITLNTLRNNTFLKVYEEADYTVSATGLNDANNVSHTVTAANGDLSVTNGSGKLRFTKKINKNNKDTETTTVSLESEFTRPVTVTGTSYKYKPTKITTANVAADAQFTYPSIRLMSASDLSAPSLDAIINDGTPTGFEAGVQVLSSEVKNYPLTAITNSSSVPVKFWFGVRKSAGQPSSIRTGDANNQYAVAPAGLITVDLALGPDTDPGNGYTKEAYTFYGFNIAANATTHVVIS